MFLQQFEGERFVSLGQRSVADHVGKHDGGESTLFSGDTHVSSLWFLFAEFLKARIISKRVEHRIEPEQRGSERHVFSQ